MAGKLQLLYGTTAWISRWPKLVLAAWLLVAVLLAPIAPTFLDQATISFDPPPGSPSARDQEVVAQYMPEMVEQAQFVGMIKDRQAAVSKLPGIEEFAENLHESINSSGICTLFLPSGGMINLFQKNGLKMPLVVSEDDDAMIFVWTVGANPTSKEMQEFGLKGHDIFMDLMQNWTATYDIEDRVDFRATLSMGEVVVVAMETVKADFERVDMVSLPLAIVTLYFVVGSGRLLLVTGSALLLSTVISCGVLSLLSMVATMEAVTPVLVMALLVALSVDYSLFILTRFCEELVRLHGDKVGPARMSEDVDQESFREALCTTMATSGATIVLSGLILVVAFAFLAAFPVNLIANMGLGCALSLLIMIAVNLTFVPAFMSLFHNFFSKSISPSRMGARAWRCFTNTAVRRALRVGSQANLLEASAAGRWHQLVKYSTTWPTNWAILLAVVGVTACFAWPVVYLQTTVDLKQDLPHGSDMYRVIETLTDEFGGGTTNPYNVMLLPRDRHSANPTPILSKKFFKDSRDFFAKIQKEMNVRMPEANNTGYYFISYVNSPIVSLPVEYRVLGLTCQLPGFPKSPLRPPSACGLLNQLTNTQDYQHQAPTAMTGLITAGVDPFSVDGDRFLQMLRSLVDEYSHRYNLDVYITGTAAYGVDMVDSVYGFFPLMITATLVTAGLFMGLTFRSIVMPLRAILTNLLSLGFTYGITVMIYQFGALNCLGIGNVSNTLVGLPWIIPCVVFFILTGLGLDYDIFLSVRITELRAEGLEPAACIRGGFVSTIGTITSAGIVMMFTFGAMVFSSLVNNVVMAIMMVLSVFYISIIVPTIINPNVMSLLGYFNWWPSAYALPDEGRELGTSLQPKA